MPNPANKALYLDPSLRSEGYYRDLQRKNLLRLVLIYLAPLIILSVYFYFQYRTILRESSQNQLGSAVEIHSHNAEINIIAFSATIIVLIFSVIVIRSRRIVQTIQQADATRAQLSDDLLHASKLAAVGELASGIAHEINNPLAIINEEAGLMQDMISSKFSVQVTLQDLSPHLTSIQEAVYRCRDITGKLLDFVRKSAIRVEPLNLHRLVDEVVHGFYGRELAVANIEIIRSYCREELLVLADKTQLGQVFLNLINNAIDAIEGRGRITITTTLQWDDRVKIEIQDTGRGMAPEQLQKLFTPFYTTKQAGKGTGLGLSISYAIIKSMTGEISVVSTAGRGTTFSILLPVHKPGRPLAEV